MNQLESKSYQVEIKLENLKRDELDSHLLKVFKRKEEYVLEENLLTCMIVIEGCKETDYHDDLMSAISCVAGEFGECIDYFEIEDKTS